MTEVIVECADVHSEVYVAWEQTAEANLVPSSRRLTGDNGFFIFTL